MHLLLQETVALDAAEPAIDLGQSPADLVFLSFSDGDLGSAAEAWRAMPAGAPSLRLASLARLRHPMSVDLYLHAVVAQARAVVVRLLGGLDYWRYGAEELAALCRQRGIALLLLPGDARDDPRLGALGTAPAAALAQARAWLDEGGPGGVARALRLAARLAGLDVPAPPDAPPLPAFGPVEALARDGGPRCALVFYRSHLVAGDTLPLAALADALAARGLGVRAMHVASLKDAAAARFVAAALRAWRPAVVLNCTGFSARGADGASPLEAAGGVVLQAVMAGSSHAQWAESRRGLGQADLAMQVVLPELDGRLLTTAISFKAADDAVPGLQYAPLRHRPFAPGIALAADRAAGWARLAAAPRAGRRVAVVLSDYPGIGGQTAHAVGLDSWASLSAILAALAAAGYAAPDAPAPEDLARALCGPAAMLLPLGAYRSLFATLPAPVGDAVRAAWGEPETDAAVRDGAFHLPHARFGNVACLVQPDRGTAAARQADYHDPDRPPRHLYVAFHLWLRHVLDAHAVVHLGTHGTLEWLPGKAAALSPGCLPAALLGGLPLIYPFIVNNPGEAAAAKRRLGAVTIGHLTPPLIAGGLHGPLAELERLIDEFAAADGLDRRRTGLMRRAILDRAAATGLLRESGVAPGASDTEALARLDAWLCDVKAMQVRDGLHVFGTPPDPARRAALLASLPATHAAALDRSAGCEMQALLAALDGRFVPPGPAGAPTRGRPDVLPTGRNLFAIDPRAVPTRSAVALAERAEQALLRRYRQDHGDWPRRLVLDLWGSTTMRTGGEDLALALLLLGVRPQWDDASARVCGVRIVPLAVLDRPRVDVTLRVSGLFRDAFAAQIALFDAAVQAVAARDEATDWNPLAGQPAPVRRIYGAAPGAYGAGVSEAVARGGWQTRDDLGRDYLAASAHAYGAGQEGVADAAGFAARVRDADAMLHQQDHAETDLLDSTDTAAHQGGFAAAAALLGGDPALYHADTSRPEAPRLRGVAEEIARVVRGRAANPRWIAGMMRHGHRGAAEIARGIEALHAFAATLPARFDAQFDALFDATLGCAAVDRFLRAHNPPARAALAARFREAARRDLWRPRRNSVLALLDEHLPDEHQLEEPAP